MMNEMIKVTVFRFEPDKDTAPRYETYETPSGTGVMVLDVLNYIREHYDPTLRFRHSCHMGKCGSCAVMVNGKAGLACWELARPDMVIEPLRGFPLIADLIVERTDIDLQKEGLLFERKTAAPQGAPEVVVISRQREIDEARKCISCFSCVAACPYAYAEEKEFGGPKKMVEIARHACDPRQDETRPLRISFKHGVWDCVACRACIDACPQQIDAREHIRQLRAMLLERPTLEAVPRQVRRLNESIITLKNPYHYPIGDKGKWAAGLEVKDLSRGDKAACLFFAGCAQSYDERDQAIAKGLAKLFRQAGLDFGIMGKDEPCCGDPAWCTGEESLAEFIKGQTAETFTRLGVNEIVTTCPHGFYRFQSEWAGNGKRARHYVQTLVALLRAGRLKPAREVKRTVAYHDSCYLGRYSGLYDEPREVLRSVPGLKLVEMKDNRERSLCCGGGGGGSFLDIKARPRLSWVRVKQAQSAGADTIAVACPQCRALLEDAVKNADAAIEVKHISELVAEAL